MGERIETINSEGVVCQFGSTWGIGLEDAWKEIKCNISGNQYDYQLKQHLPNDYFVGNNVLMFQVHPTLGIEDIETIVTVVKKIMKKAINN